MNEFDLVAHPPENYYDFLPDFEVPTGMEAYRVIKNGKDTYQVSRIYHCTCLGYHHTGKCKHISAIMFQLNKD